MANMYIYLRIKLLTWEVYMAISPIIFLLVLVLVLQFEFQHLKTISNVVYIKTFS